MNPFVLAREELVSPRPADDVLACAVRLLARGIVVGDRRYRLFGACRGRYVTMSLGMPFFGGSAPVLRAWLPEGPGPTRFEAIVGHRIEVMLGLSLALTLAVLGGGYQLVLQFREVLAGHAPVRAVLEVLPGIAIFLGLVGLMVWISQRRGAQDAKVMLAALRHAIEADAPGGASPWPIE